MSRLKVLNVEAVGLAGRFQTARFDGLVDVLELGFIEDGLCEAEDVVGASAAVGDVGGHVGFEGAVAHEDHDGVYRIRRQLQEGAQGFGVFVILSQRVLEGGLFTIDHLGPFGLFFRSVYPAPHVFGFDAENPEARYNNVIDLSAAVFRRQRDIVIDLI